MVASLKFFVAILLSTLVSEGLCQECSLDNLNIGQARSGRVIQGKPEWNVTVTNNCNCARVDMVLSCVGFQTVEEIDPSIFFKEDGGRCRLLNAKKLTPFASVKFSYAWDPPFLLLPMKAIPQCSM